MNEKKFLGADCLEVKFGNFTLLFTLSVGPRIISLKYGNSDNLFAELPDASLDYLNGGKFHLYGGHRLWLAPEDPALTYIPDDWPVNVNSQPGTVELTQEVDRKTGLRKIIRVQDSGNKDAVIVDHLVCNEGSSDKKIAPWAITQMKIGGTAVLPLKSTNVESPFLPDRSLILWPYTDIYDERIHVHKDFIFVQTLPKNEKAVKVGVSNTQKWAAYYTAPYLFIKYSNKADNGCSLDLGAEAQCYCDNKCLELETLGLYQVVRPGETVVHREIWRIAEKPFSALTPEVLHDFIKQDEMAAVFQGML
jgi:hypothetical protein